MQPLGRYEILKQLGEGGFARVYQARDPALGRDVALKVLLSRHTGDPAIHARFLDEARTLARLHHPNIVTIHDIGEVEGQPYFAMELVRGETLAVRLLRLGALSLDTALAILEPLCAAIDYLHEQDLVHRDLKASNIMIDDSGRVILMDFGIVRALDQSTHTTLGTVLGTPGYMAPEQVLGKSVTPATDVYALGVLTYQLLSGTLPFTGDTMQVLYAHAHEQPPPLQATVPGLSPSAYSAVDAALAKDPLHRPPSALRFAALLERGELAPSDTTLVYHPQYSWRRRWPIIAAGTATIVLGGTAAVFMVFHGFARDSETTGAIALSTTEAVSPLPGTASRGTTIAGSGVLPLGTPRPTVTVAATSSAQSAPAPVPSPDPMLDKTSPRTTATLAGSGASGFADGLGAAARFAYPQGVAVDGTGNVYVPDLQNHRIRKIMSTGEVSTLAGSGTPGFRDGPAATAQFNNPAGIAVDAVGNVYVSDFSNHSIRVVSPSGEVRTLAGAGERGFADGTGRAARFNSPGGLAVDAAGNVYVADIFNHRVRRISPSGVVTTIAGTGVAGFADGPAARAQFNDPAGVAVDSSGNVYVADFNNNRIRRISPDGNVATLSGGPSAGLVDGVGDAARFNGPTRLAIDTLGALYVADLNNQVIRVVLTNGSVFTIAGNGSKGTAEGTGQGARFNQPEGVAVDATGVLYIADAANNRIRRLGP